MTLQVGDSIGHYEIVEELGAGGNGRVLKVQHLITRRREAMKILADGKPDSQEQAHRFLREIRLQASLDHPNIAAVLNAFWLEDDLVMVMELIDGQTLASLVELRRFSLDQSLTIIRQVLLALSYAHQNGVIHRDVSPGNIIVSPNGRIKLTDFGLAKGVSDPHVTEMGGMYGTPFYISPEQVRGTATVDHRTDIYSTAIVLYELLTGTRPFIAPSSFLLMQAHVQQIPEPPIFRNAAIPQFLNAAILKAMAKNPADRFQSADEFLAAIDGPQAAAAPAQAATITQPSATPHLTATPLPQHEPAPVQPAPLPAAPIPAAPIPAAPIPAAPEYTHSFLTPVNPDYTADLEPGSKKASAKSPSASPKNSAPPSALGRKSPLLGALIGLGVVAAIVIPLLLYRSASRPTPASASPVATPNSVALPAPTSRSEVPSPVAPAAEPIQLTPGPRSLPGEPIRTVPTRTGAATPRPRTRTVTAPQPLQMKIWGASPASEPAPSTAAAPKTPLPARAPTERTERLEEPPTLAPSRSPVVLSPAVTPTVQPLPQAPPERKGLFRRLARGMKALNPIKRDPQTAPATSPAAKP